MTPVQGMSAREDAMEEQMKIPAQKNNGTISDRRRKLLKAAVATAPVIATLPNGSVFANASIQQCIPGDKKRQPTPQLSKTPRHESNDQWQEVTLERLVYKSRHGSTKTRYKYSGDFFKDDDRNSGYLVSADLDFLKERDKKGGRRGGKRGKKVWDDNPKKEGVVYALRYYEPNSQKTGLRNGPSLKKGGKHGWTALTGTCLTSLKKVV
ncbi:MAG: hypothetical protein GY696_04780 [Gammaproteobacteria bacterium]|nr:hypothetical protein [Gammaproteobacteria bacterium]